MDAFCEAYKLRWMKHMSLDILYGMTLKKPKSDETHVKTQRPTNYTDLYRR